MTTFSTKEVIDRLIAGDGWLAEYGDRDAPDNPPANRIVEYTNFSGRRCWGVVFEGEFGDPFRYEQETGYIRNPKLIWTRHHGKESE
jgi:hypothetical protein